ncbi:DUF4328 domain-containing protein [Mycobacterium sp. TNTM28]|uniref:DUF4328 domain-containing protein n=1 Tax=[Mycobacterium] fortunisiensis TaxID=2600579 RepID=A0ABS6KUR0_9MYCO|nr:DUF4328 domain-containing protein [[Mycobacterium] fortunisiensis]MBU9767194.1 DUF4328 domain-containing protein [[Mycobacterium] fortunisiensis]
MIQVCSQCGTRWNVRDRQRSWCPRCGGSLLAPSAPHSQWGPARPSPSSPAQPSAPASRTTPQLAPGYRWIAVRPGPPPQQRRRRGPLGPTPRYRVIPSWGLHQQFEPSEPAADAAGAPSGVSAVRTMLVVAMVALGVAAFAHVIRYVLLLINRGMLLPPLVAIAGVILGLLASLLAIVAVVFTVVVLVNWLIARRSAGYARHGEVDPRSSTTLWLGCLVPGVNLVMAPVFVWELAALEGRLSFLRRPIVVWWIVWVLSGVVATWSMATTVYATFFNPLPQNIADNTVTTIVGYLLALCAFLLAAKVFAGFEGSATTAVQSVHRWVVVEEPEVTATSQNGEDSPESAVAVETEGQNPAA